MYVVDGEPPILNKGARMSDRFFDTQEPQASPFRFTRMLEKQGDQPPDHLLEALGEKMARDRRDAQSDSSIPAGYTYLGQFIAHEITHNGSEYKKDLQTPEQMTSPSVNLGSLYGEKLLSGDEDTSHYLEIGQTKLDEHVELPQFLNDLPRKNGTPDIIEKRNDNNLNLAQIHVALIRFHNAVASRLAKNGPVSAGEIRKIVIQHFQSIILYDYLAKIVNEEVYCDVVKHGATFYRPSRSPADPYPAMPLEFAMAAFRFGHSMVRSHYTPDWNPYHQNPGLNTLLSQTNNVGKIDQLPSSWIASWSRLFDFHKLVLAPRKPLCARRIDTRIAKALSELPVEALPAPAPSTNLPIRTLLFGSAARLPSGENASRQIDLVLEQAGRKIPPVGTLSEDEIAADEDEDVRCILEDPGMRGNTPLWFYILKEAQLRERGERLGPLGGRIVMEVLYELIAHSNYSILQEKNWRPCLPSVSGGKGYSMTDLLALAGDIDPFQPDVGI